MPSGYSPNMTAADRSARARKAAAARWAKDPIDQRIEALARRAPAMTAEQAAKLRVILDSVDARVASARQAAS